MLIFDRKKELTLRIIKETLILMFITEVSKIKWKSGRFLISQINTVNSRRLAQSIFFYFLFKVDVKYLQ